jgi:TolA-binding protein
MGSLVTKRSYNRRSEEDQIRELQAKVAELKALAEAKSRKDLPVVREWPKTQRALRAFMQIAMQHKREDLAISAQAFMAGIERTLDPDTGSGRTRRSRSDESSDRDD